MQQSGLVGVFEYLDDLLAALEALKRGKSDFTVFAPVALHEIKEAIGMKTSRMRLVTLLAALSGITFGLSLAVFTVEQWHFVVSGKPVVPWIPFVIVAFEFCILFGVVIPFVGLLIIGRIPRLRLPSYYDPRFSNDRFGVLVRCGEGEHEEIVKLLKEAGAEEVNEVQG